MLVPATVEDKEEYLEERREATFIAENYINEKSRSGTFYEEIVHPNEENDDGDVSHLGGVKSNVGWVNSSFVKWFSKFDEEKLRPFFIRKYNAATVVLEDEYQELLQQKLRDEQEEEDLVERVDNMRRTVSAASRPGADYGQFRNLSYNDPSGDF